MRTRTTTLSKEKRELLLAALASGQTNKVIRQEFGISDSTIIYYKNKVSSSSSRKLVPLCRQGDCASKRIGKTLFCVKHQRKEKTPADCSGFISPIPKSRLMAGRA